MEQKKLDRTSFIYSMSKEHAPALRVNSGDQVVIDTYDCFEDQITSEQTTFQTVDWNRINPATGPVYVEEAQPGDVLKVSIDEIKLGNRGVMSTGPNLGVMGHQLENFEVKVLPVQDGHVAFDDQLQIPLNPMIGVIGVAPEKEAVSNGTPGAHGGNMDTKLIAKGATLYFPVFHQGALFALGDLHAAMGDGEIGVSGVEIPGEVTVTLEVLKEKQLQHPIVENNDGVAFLVSKETLDEAVDVAVEEMIQTLKPYTNLSLGQLTMLMSAVGQVQVSQVVDPLKTARFFVPRYVLEAYGIQLFPST
ncbi:acetamidase/formamidase family protein [Salirhabdus salicampi]|uniref:acetamidase/formamidase family protein n=1 Tax=Salirhabdus salicampi TaxID=476102 RepID=UPI0020C38873|nr:acetamidase/formamidase family protein [Salirhabdus salicampi]MCP8618126.1 acetamidase/formamidase family protein [Salirhabdus salicampi]